MQTIKEKCNTLTGRDISQDQPSDATVCCSGQWNAGKSHPLLFEIAKLPACIVSGKSAVTQRVENSNWQVMSKTQENPILLENIEIILNFKHICRNMLLHLEYAIATKNPQNMHLHMRICIFKESGS